MTLILGLQYGFCFSTPVESAVLALLAVRGRPLLAQEDTTKPLPVSYAQRFAAAQSSAAQIEQQLTLVEELLDDETASPAVVAALRQARASLRHGGH